MAAVVIPSGTPTPPPSLGALSSQPPASVNTAPIIPVSVVDRSVPVPIPNKHMPNANPNGFKISTPVTPPASPPNEEKGEKSMDSLLYPPDAYTCIIKSPPVYAIDAKGVAAAINFTSRQPLPDINQVFPWAHGLHPENSMQLAFFYARKKAARRPPITFRGLCIVKIGRYIERSRLKGSIIPEEILPLSTQTPGFLQVDPKDGFNVRNFHIQVGKFAGLSDIIVYGDDETDPAAVLRIARRISNAQIYHRNLCQTEFGQPFPIYNTFIVQDPFSTFEESFPELILLDSSGSLTGNVIDFCHWERMEMCSMSRASEISHNVYLGTSADARFPTTPSDTPEWDVLIESSDLAPMPLIENLHGILETMDRSSHVQHLQFPGSGSIAPATWSRMDVDGIIDTCRWIYAVANGKQTDTTDRDGDVMMKTSDRKPRKVLIHCADGYTETSLLGLAYLMYSDVIPVHEAWVRLHTTKNRNFFAYDKDLAFLRYIEHTLLDAAARDQGMSLNYASMSPPEWIYRMDGSLPSRVLSYMYLGNLLHANNFGLLKALGIKRVLSIGENVSWSDEEKREYGADNLMVLRDLQDNGCDALEYQFWRCLDFIEEGRRKNEPVLVHCRVGVSRSATICIAEVMRSMKLSLPRAYCYVRARRLNVIIQPHLRFMYELLKFEETLSQRQNHSTKRELEWMHVAREVAAMNRPYIRQG
ncbi:hypothetical protein EX30DRAFT_347744 [Ascodesmis nigricans]|uniref:Uncharacterized protein n=1 Tax=Ascodesmis nigricans TaxID=341454 RepID=A0A4S2N0C4_9PEZI|nr:hypothetical protein EX30DRAFT_347744 [Ascodesmis nigricans]